MPQNIKTYTFEFAGETLVALVERALWWPAKRVLFITDLHAGKLGHFQRFGIPLPDHEVVTDLERLDRIIAMYSPKRLIILGDMFHSDANEAWPRLMSWRATHPTVSIELVMGNHDRWLSAATITTGGFKVWTKPFQFEPFLLSHEPVEDTSAYNLCGHIHPATILKSRGNATFRLPCFVITPQQLILPAFGSFTGMHHVRWGPDHTLLAVSEAGLIPVY